METETKFFWGAATSSHQSEGNNQNDWTQFEFTNAQRLANEAEKKIKPLVPDWESIKAEATNPDNYISGIASDHFAKFSEDIDIMKSLGLNAYRFSIEWSRLFPEDNNLNQATLDHYRDVIFKLHSQGLEPFVTIWHRSLPTWIAKQGGWENKKTISDFGKYVDTLVQHFGHQVKYWMPMNEPNLFTGAAYAGGGFPPGKNNLFSALKVLRNLAKAQAVAFNIIKSARPEAQVGIPMAAVFATAYKGRWYNKLLVSALHYVANWLFLDLTKKFTDFVGVQYYRRGIIRLKLGGKFLLKIQDESIKAEKRSDLGWEVYPEGIYQYCEMVWKRYGKNIIITENGIADAEDKLRGEYIKSHVQQVMKAKQDGMPIHGYFYWSLLDNLEWDKGFWPKFGLISITKQDETRKIRKSAATYTEVIRQHQAN